MLNRFIGRIVNDGRCVSVIFVIGYFALLFWIHRSIGYDKAWARAGVPHMDPVFADLRVITSAVDCADLGHDPLASNPCDPWRRPMNYPRIWLAIGSMLHLHYQYSTALGIGLAVLFFATCFLVVGRLNLAEGVTLGILLGSPPVMYAVERGNNDLLVFILLSLALVGIKNRRFSRRWWSYCLVLVAGILKLYPVCALVLCCREKPRWILWITAVFVTAFGLYLAVTYHDLQFISAVTPRSSFSSYGSRVLFDRLKGHHLPSGLDFLPWMGVGVASFSAVFVAHSLPRIQVPEHAKDSLRLGSMMYVATFALGNNWNYRLVLLLLATPGIFATLRDKKSVTIGCLLLVAMMSMLLLSTAVDAGRALFCIREIVAWISFILLMAVLIQLLPDSLVPSWTTREGS
jgi:Glycosyltransferase family 87